MTLVWPNLGKSWRMQETLFNYPKVYLVLQLGDSHWEKERESGKWDYCVSSANTSNISCWERDNRHKPQIFLLVFCCSSNMLVCWVVSSLRHLLECTPKMRLVNLHFLKSSRLMFNCMSLPHHVLLSSPQNESYPPFHLVSVGGTSTFPCIPDLGPPVFSSHPQLIHQWPTDPQAKVTRRPTIRSNRLYFWLF